MGVLALHPWTASLRHFFLPTRPPIICLAGFLAYIRAFAAIVMTIQRTLLIVGLLLAGVFSGKSATGVPWLDGNTNLNFYGDLRLRYELDWDSQTASGTQRDDRNRGRLRARAGFDYRITEDWSGGARLRTGDSDSQQSPHLTFATDEGDRDDLDFVVDRYFIQYKRNGLMAWGGRNITPFWQQNELYWDEDVTPTGLAASYEKPYNDRTLAATAGAFYLPDGGYGLNGQMVAGQLKFTMPVDRAKLTASAGLNYMHGHSGATYLHNRNGARDYLIGVGNAQWGFQLKGIPVALGADIFYNFLNYNAADVAPFPASDEDQTLGYDLSVTVGRLKERHDWLVGYVYAHIETFSVNASYAQDDWVRFGSGGQTDSSDFEGHEIRAGYSLSKNINLLARLYLVQAITTRQDGNRFRLDLNWKF